MRRRPIEDARKPVRPAEDAALGGELRVAAAFADRAADEPLVRPGAVHRGGVEKGHADVERAMDRADRFLVVPRPITLRHAHAPEADRGNLEPALSQFTSCHTAM